jgi:hypothetical protein
VFRTPPGLVKVWVSPFIDAIPLCVGDVATGRGLNIRISREAVEITVECLEWKICGAVVAQLRAQSLGTIIPWFRLIEPKFLPQT